MNAESAKRMGLTQHELYQLLGGTPTAAVANRIGLTVSDPKASSTGHRRRR